MDLILLWLVYFLLGTSLVGVFRVIRGPSLADRLIGLNLVSAQILAILVLLAVRKQTTAYLDVALVYDIFGFVGLLAITNYFSRKRSRP